MAENIAFSITIGGVDREIKTMQDLKKAIKDANNELLQAGEVGTQSYAEAQKKVTDLKDRLGDLGDAAKVQGTAVEKLGASTGLLGEGFKNLDLDKIKIGFKGIGDAIKANPLMFLIGIIIPLLEKFKVFEILIGGVSKAFDLLTDAIGFTNHADEEATKNFLSNAQERQKIVTAEYDARIKVAKAEGKDTYNLEQEKLKTIQDSLQSQYNNLLELSKKKKGLNDEEAKQFKDLQLQLINIKADIDAQKAQRLQENLSKEFKYRKESEDAEAARLKELTDKYKQAYQEQLQANQDLINKTKALKNKDYLDSITDERQKALETLRIQNEAQVEDINKSKASKKVKNEALAQLDIDYRLQQESINKQFDDKEKENQLKKQEELRLANEKAEQDRIAALQKANQDALNEEANYNELRILQTQEDTQARLDAEIEAIQFKLFRETQLTEKSEGEKLLIKKRAEQSIDKLREDFAKKERERRFKETQDNLATSALVNKGLTDLSTVFYNTKLNNAKKGSAEEEKILKEQFEVNKAFQIANAVINGAMAVTSILASPANKIDPSGTVMAIQIAAAIASTAAQISTIERTRFQGGAPQAPEAPNMGGAGGQAPTGTPQMPQTRTEQGTFLNEQGQTTGRLDTRVYVLESDITNTQRDVNRVKTQSKV
jgi:hypothetical protein